MKFTVICTVTDPDTGEQVERRRETIYADIADEAEEIAKDRWVDDLEALDERSTEYEISVEEMRE